MLNIGWLYVKECRPISKLKTWILVNGDSETVSEEEK